VTINFRGVFLFAIFDDPVIFAPSHYERVWWLSRAESARLVRVCTVTRAILVSHDRHLLGVHLYFAVTRAYILSCLPPNHIRPHSLQPHHLGRDLRTRRFHHPYVQTPRLSPPPHNGPQSHQLRPHGQPLVQPFLLQPPLQNARRRRQWTYYANTMG
jgi:hypothetical protein